MPARETLQRLLSGTLAEIERQRRALGISSEMLAARAGLSRSTYVRAIGTASARPATVRRLEAALAALRSERRAVREPDTILIRAVYGGFVASIAVHMGVRPDDVHAQDPRLGATADPEWRRLAQVRQAAIYLTNTVVDVRQARLAHVLGLTTAAVCLGLRSVEDRRDDPDFDALLERLTADVVCALARGEAA